VDESRPSAQVGPTTPAALPDAPKPAPPAPPDFSDPSWNRIESRAGTYTLHWRAPCGAVPRNQDFELEVWVLRQGVVTRDVILDVHAWMPDHGHGMLRKTRSVTQADGSFRVEGMLLHMRGHWKVFFDLLEGAVAETAECAIDL
jgi:hypothetical protein